MDMLLGIGLGIIGTAIWTGVVRTQRRDSTLSTSGFNFGSTIIQDDQSVITVTDGTMEINGVLYTEVHEISIKRIQEEVKTLPVHRGPLELCIKGSVNTVQAHAHSVSIEGDVGSADTSQGKLTITGNVKGDVEAAQGSISIGGDVSGSVETSQGSIKVQGDIHGNAKTSMGSVTCSGCRKCKRL